MLGDIKMFSWQYDISERVYHISRYRVRLVTYLSHIACNKVSVPILNSTLKNAIMEPYNLRT